jgi:Na+/proline symporter
MGYLSYLDYAIIGAYFVVIIGMGLYLQKRAASSMEDYFLGGRKLPWWMLGVSGMGWSLDITGTMVIVSLLYWLGMRQVFVGFRGDVQISVLFMMIWTGKWHRRSGCMTVAEWMTFRFGTGAGGQFARVAQALAVITYTVGMLAYMVVGMGGFMSLFMPFTPMQCAGIMIGIATLYTVTSGFYGVVFSDLFQCLLILAGVIAVSIMAAVKVMGTENFPEIATTVTQIPEWMSSFPEKVATMPEGYHYENLLTYTLGFLLLKSIIGGFGTGGTPQYFAAKNERECGKLSFLWGALMTFRWPMMISYAVLGFFLVMQFFPNQGDVATAAALVTQHLGEISPTEWGAKLAHIIHHPELYTDLVADLKSLFQTDWQDKLALVAHNGNIDAEKILPAVLLHSIPGGLRGLILVTLIAATMSTFDMTVNWAASMFTKDIYQAFFRKTASTKELIYASYLFIIGMVAVAFLFAGTAENINDIWDWITMALGSGLAVPIMIRLYWWRFNGGGFAISMAAGMACAVGIRIWNGSEMGAEMPIAEQWQFVIGTVVPLVAAIVGTYITKPTDQAVLENFYKKTRPFGFWKPFVHLIPKDKQPAMRREHRNDLISLPFAILWMTTMFLLPMQLVVQAYKPFWITLALFIVSLIGLYRFWYLNLPVEVEDTDASA